MSTKSAPETKQRILDAAEHLFATRGYHNTSMRAITTAADVNLASINYHFGSKEALLNAVFERRLLPLNEIRRKRIEAIRDAARDRRAPPSVEQTLRAFLEPTFQFRDSGGTEDFVALIGRAISEPDEVVSKSFVEHIEPVLQLLFATLSEALPELSRDTVFWRMQFALGSMSHTMRMRQWSQYLPKEVNFDLDTEELMESLLAFMTAGVEWRCRT